MAESKENAAAIKRMREEATERMRELERKGQTNTGEYRSKAGLIQALKGR